MIIFHSLSSTDDWTIFFSNLQNESTTKKVDNGSSCVLLESGEEKQPTSFAEPSSKFETIVPSLHGSICNSDSSTSRLPAWLQNYKTENKRVTTNDQVFITTQTSLVEMHTHLKSNRTRAMLNFFVHTTYLI